MGDPLLLQIRRKLGGFGESRIELPDSSGLDQLMHSDTTRGCVWTRGKKERKIAVVCWLVEGMCAV